MRVVLLLLLLCGIIASPSRFLRRSESGLVIRELSASPESAQPGSDVSLIPWDLGSAFDHIDNEECVPPPELQWNRTGFLGDGTFGCSISSNDPDKYGSQKQCQTNCSSIQPPADVFNGTGPAIICWTLTYPSGPCQGQFITSRGVTLGRCLCDVKVLDFAVNWIATVAVPYIAEFICEALFGIAKLLAEVGISFIPYVGPLTEAEWTLLAGVTGFTNRLNLTDIDLGNSFTSWINDPCDPKFQLGKDMNAFFDDLAGVAAGRGLPVGPKRPSPLPPKPAKPSVASPAPSKSVSPSSVPASAKPTVSSISSTAASPPSKPTQSTPPPTLSASNAGSSLTQPTTSTPTSSDNACRLARRDQGRKSTEDAWSYCKAGTWEVTTITSIIFGKENVVVPQLCSSKWSHACIHYSSVLSVSSAKGWETLRCGDFLGRKEGSRDRLIVAQWNNEHQSEWYAAKWRQEKNCDRDEYPPVYFFTDGDAVLTERQQLVKLLPYRDNRGAGAGLWGPFCWTEGLKDSKAYLYTKAIYDYTTVQRGTTSRVTEIGISVSFRPHFSISAFLLGTILAVSTCRIGVLPRIHASQQRSSMTNTSLFWAQTQR